MLFVVIPRTYIPAVEPLIEQRALGEHKIHVAAGLLMEGLSWRPHHTCNDLTQTATCRLNYVGGVFLFPFMYQ